MTEFKQMVKDIILEYCEGNTHLEFNKNDLPEMLGRIEEAISVTRCYEKLKVKEEISFEQWRNENCKHLTSDLFNYEGDVLDSYNLRTIYIKEFKKNNL